MNLPTQSGMDIAVPKELFHPTSTPFTMQDIDEEYSARDNPGAISLDIKRYGLSNCTQSFSPCFSLSAVRTVKAVNLRGSDATLRYEMLHSSILRHSSLDSFHSQLLHREASILNKVFN
jgi:hypothetical protein